MTKTTKDAKIIDHNDDKLLKFLWIFLLPIFTAFSIFLISYPSKDVENIIDTGEDTDSTSSIEVYQFTNAVGEKYTYTGESENGQPNGTGTAIYTNSEEYTENFVNGLRDGDGIYLWTDGEKFVGEYRNNKRNGFGKHYDKAGNLIEEGNYINGELH